MIKPNSGLKGVTLVGMYMYFYLVILMYYIKRFVLYSGAIKTELHLHTQKVFLHIIQHGAS